MGEMFKERFERGEAAAYEPDIYLKNPMKR